MVQLQADLEKIEAAGIQVVGISYDSVDVLKKYAEAKEIAFLLLSDEGSETIDAFGLRNMEAPKTGRMAGIPYPGTYLLDSTGTVKAKIFLDGYAKRHATDELIEAAKGF